MKGVVNYEPAVLKYMVGTDPVHDESKTIGSCIVFKHSEVASTSNSLEEDLEEVLIKHRSQGFSQYPTKVVAEYLVNSLKNYDQTIDSVKKYYDEVKIREFY